MIKYNAKDGFVEATTAEEMADFMNAMGLLPTVVTTAHDRDEAEADNASVIASKPTDYSQQVRQLDVLPQKLQSGTFAGRIGLQWMGGSWVHNTEYAEDAALMQQLYDYHGVAENLRVYSPVWRGLNGGKVASRYRKDPW